MTNKKFTLLELHLGDGAVRIGPRSPDDGSADAGGGSTSESNATEADDGACPARAVGKLLLVVGGLVALVVVASKLLGSDEDLDELEDLADLDDVEE